MNTEQFDVYQRKYEPTVAKKILTTRENFVLMNGIKLKIKMTDEDYESARPLLFMKKKNIVEPEHAHDWIRNNVLGGITQKELD
jgi:hypothetical protein